MTRSGIRISMAGIVAAGLHVLLLAYTVVQTLNADDAHWPVYWIKFLALDFPLSLGVVPVTWIFPAAAGGPLHDVANFWWPLGYHGVIGTFWWYIVGRFVIAKYRHSQKPKFDE